MERSDTVFSLVCGGDGVMVVSAVLNEVLMSVRVLMVVPNVEAEIAVVLVALAVLMMMGFAL